MGQVAYLQQISQGDGLIINEILNKSIFIKTTMKATVIKYTRYLTDID